jgi:hypothetical protein
MYEIEHFIPARESTPRIPLQRYLDPLPIDVLSRYLTSYTSPGELVIDPVAQRPALALAAARLERKAIASNSNPINDLLVRGMLTLPAPDEMDAATTRLGDSLKRGVPLRDHINQLYASTCHHCSGTVFAQSFFWDGEESKPVEKQYHCPHCDCDGRFPIDEADLDTLDGIERQGIHFWYLLERLAQPHEPERGLAQELLQLYTPRNLCALTDLSMKMEALFAGSAQHTALSLMLLSCLDTCSKLAAAPCPRPTVLRLHPPSKFVERNVWLAFEEAYRLLRNLAPSGQVALSSGVDRLLEERGPHALILNEPLRRVTSMLPPASVSLVIGAPQAYYRPFWTLSYLWSGWLWGRQKASLLKPLLRRKIMGWSWYRRTFTAALATLHRPLRPHGRLIFLLENTDLTHVTNLILSGVGAAFKLDRVLYQPQEANPPRHPMQGVPGAYRLTFSRDEPDQPEPAPLSSQSLAAALRKAATRAVRSLLRERGEALHLGWLHVAACGQWASDGLLRQALLVDKETSAADFLQQQLQAALEEGLERGMLALLPEQPADHDGPQLWWLGGKGYPIRPLGDRLELAVCQALRAGPDLSPAQLEDSIYSRFPDLFTPGPGLLEKCLQSYAVRDGLSETWSPRPEDAPEALTREKEEVLECLAMVGRLLGYEVSPPGAGSEAPQTAPPARRQRALPAGVDVVWEDENSSCHHFAIKQTTRFGDILSGGRSNEDQAERYIVICGRRLELLRFRMETELLLRIALADGGWQFIKMNHLRALSEKKAVNRQDLQNIIGLEPLIERPDAQLPLFS